MPLASGGAEGIEKAIETNQELVILDLSLPWHGRQGRLPGTAHLDELAHPDPLGQGQRKRQDLRKG
ncbi:MAG: hypothetical protein JMJ95_05120 [Aminivibrio sp.]|nr:hypothetical protein [Aminivibrio sp.]MBL3539043.1 hypothetical protein [Aminivibrio sp.]